MIIRPVYNILLLPDVSYYFKKDFFTDWCTEPIETGTDILFIYGNREIMTYKDIYSSVGAIIDKINGQE